MLDFSSLNPAQYAAVTASDGPMLVIAGAGSGKTRTLVYRLAWLTEQGVLPSEILLLTFTKKAAKEMLARASGLLGANLNSVQGGTFHAFAYATLKHYPPDYIPNFNFTIMDTHDTTVALSQCKDKLGVSKGDRSFPKTQTILGVFSKIRNKELQMHELLKKESPHLLPYLEEFESLFDAYTKYKKEHFLLDYDDLLFELEKLFQTNPYALENIRKRFRYIMVDEYQDTNRVQARIVRHLAGEQGNIMAVGDDAQSIYAFRGANVRNILDFKINYPTAKLVSLEENYRSTQEILDIANAILKDATEAYQKNLFTKRVGDRKAKIVRPLNDLSQASQVARYIENLLLEYNAKEIAVLFRAAYQSYNLEIELNKRNIKFKKYGGIRYIEAAHIKDMLAYVRLLLNPLDMPSFLRLSSYAKGVGTKTADKLFKLFAEDTKDKLNLSLQKYPTLLEDLNFLDKMRSLKPSPLVLLEEIISHLQVAFFERYPDDYPRRIQELEDLCTTAANYEDIASFLADLSLENGDKEENEEDCITLSTVHSAKGLEWDAVVIIDLVQDRFPSKHALLRAEDFEEERRLLYVACTRAKNDLALFVPASMYDRASGSYNYTLESPFIQNIDHRLLEEWHEGYTNQNIYQAKSLAKPLAKSLAKPLVKHQAKELIRSNQTFSSAGTTDFSSAQEIDDPFANPASKAGKLGFCEHKIFGRGKIIERIEPDKYRVNFQGFGLKVIVADYLTLY